MSLSPTLSLFIDGRKLGEGGIGKFIELLIYGLLELSFDGKVSLKKTYILVSSSFYENNKLIISEWEEGGFVFFIDDIPKYGFREYFILGLKWWKYIKECDWYLSPHYTLPFFIPAKKAVVIHDLIHLKYPENLQHRIFAPYLISSSLKRADKVLPISDHVKEDILSLYPDCLDRTGKIIPNSTTMKLNENSPLLFNDRINFLSISADRDHKRFSLLLEFIAGLKNLNQKVMLTLVTKPSRKTLETIQQLDISSEVVIKTDISSKEMEECFYSASFYVNTSIIEGFCIPILDAMRTKTPVFCPDLKFSRNLLQDNGWFFNAFSLEDMYRQFAKFKFSFENNPEKIEQSLNNAYNISLNYNTRSQAAALLESIK